MSYQATVYSVVVASPGDVQAERALIRETIFRWNDLNTKDMKVILMPRMWEFNSYPDYGERPQAVLNEQVLEGADLLIGVFWTRVGSPTGVAPSGTVEEIHEIHKAGKPVMIYFSEKGTPPGGIDSKQLESLNKLKKEMRSQGLYYEFHSDQELESKLMAHLTLRVREMQRLSEESSKGAIEGSEHTKERTVEQSVYATSQLPKLSEFDSQLQQTRMANRDGYWLSILFDFETSDDKFSSPEKKYYRKVANELYERLFKSEFTTDIISTTDHISISIPKDRSDFAFKVWGQGVLVVQFRGDHKAIPMRWIVSRVLETFGIVESLPMYANASAIRFGLCLSNWPEKGIDTVDLLHCESTRDSLQGISEIWSSEHMRATFDVELELKKFLERILEKWGYLDFEESLDACDLYDLKERCDEDDETWFRLMD